MDSVMLQEDLGKHLRKIPIFMNPSVSFLLLSLLGTLSLWNSGGVDSLHASPPGSSNYFTLKTLPPYNTS